MQAPGLPSHEGSGLKLRTAANIGIDIRLPSHEGSGLKYKRYAHVFARACLPSHEGSGLKYFNGGCKCKAFDVSPRMRGVD